MSRPMKDFIKTKFGLYDEDTPIYEGYYLPNNRWNGWLQPLVDEENFKKIIKDIMPSDWDDVDDRSYWEDFKNQKPTMQNIPNNTNQQTLMVLQHITQTITICIFKRSTYKS